MPPHGCECQKTNFKRSVLFIMWVLGAELKLSDWAASKCLFQLGHFNGPQNFFLQGERKISKSNMEAHAHNSLRLSGLNQKNPKLNKLTQATHCVPGQPGLYNKNLL